MADLTLRDIKKSYGNLHILHGIDLEIKSGEFIVFVGPSGCGKSTLLRSIAGLEDITCGHAEDRRRGGQRRAAVEARHRHGVPVLCALSAHDRLRQHGLRHEDRQGEQGPRSTRACAQAAEILQLDQISRPPAQGAVGRPAPARRHRPRHRARAEGVPVRRAAVQPRRGAARRHPHRDRQAQGEHAQHDHDLRHPRPGRGDDAGRPHRRAEGRHDRAGRHADGALQAARQPVRRPVHRLAGDEHPAGEDRQGRGADRRQSMSADAPRRCRSRRRLRPRARPSASACGPRIWSSPPAPTICSKERSTMSSSSAKSSWSMSTSAAPTCRW